MTISQRGTLSLLKRSIALLAVCACLALPALGQATITVNTTSDGTLPDANCTLREALNNANANGQTTSGECTAGIGNTDVIEFNIAGGGVQTIQPTTGLPSITDGLTIDGYSQPGASANTLATGSDATLLIEIDGSNTCPSVVNGLFINATNVTVRGLVINRFCGSGILLINDSNTIAGNFIGTDASGAVDLGNALNGVAMNGGGSNTIGGTDPADRNVISGNNQFGVPMVNAGATGNMVLGNYIGTDASGTAMLGNGGHGVWINGVGSNTIGGTAAGAGNVIANNGGSGIWIGSGGATGNIVLGNLIGTDATGTVDHGNSSSGVSIASGGSMNTIGGTDPNAGNVISGNAENGISINNAAENTVLGNIIGLDVNGTTAMPNTFSGVALIGAATSMNEIGGTAAGAGNTISGNTINGVNITTSATGNMVQGNLIGTNATGTGAIGNTLHGVSITSSATMNEIGGTAAGAGNTISGNGEHGVNIAASASSNTVQGNHIGTNAAGTADLGNAGSGVSISDAASNTIGGTVASAGNVISGNDENGVGISGAGATGNLVQGNHIGTNVAGSAAVANTFNGVAVNDGASSNEIGGNVLGAGNVISGNTRDGVLLSGATTTDNLVQGNRIGTDATGLLPLGNAQQGILLFETMMNQIGGTTAETANVIAANGVNGIFVSASSQNTIQGNRIGTDSTGTATTLGNASHGVELTDSPSNTIGGTVAGARNIISGNGANGVRINGTPSTGNLVQGNRIGTNAAGTMDLGNTGGGVSINDAPSNTIGGTTAGAGNTISGNDASGISLSGANATGNLVQGNHIGTNAAGTAAIGNMLNGVTLSGSATLNEIGGTAAGAGNVISGNTINGILLADAGTINNTIAGNFIGTDATGTLPLGNSQRGVMIFEATMNTVGGTAAGARNIISSNTSGVFINASSDNTVQGNFIGTDATGTMDLGNAEQGVDLLSASSNMIGGTLTGAGNLISGNGAAGVRIGDPSSTDNVVQGNRIGTDVTGTVDLGNTGSGISINDAPSNTIGGTVIGAGNVISGNDASGIGLAGVDATGTMILGNRIGTDAAATVALGNGTSGIFINDAPSNTIGGTTSPEQNIISGNAASGITLFGTNATGNMVLGNRIGTDSTGIAAIGNTQRGVNITGGASMNQIGGTAVGAGNVISGNGAAGVRIADPSSTGNLLLGNRIGTNTPATAGLANGSSGITISNAPASVIGGVDPGAGNVISSNTANGIGLTGAATTGTMILGNFIGTDAAGTANLGNTLNGVSISGDASMTAIGGTAAGAGNTIAFNGQDGVIITSDASLQNAILSNVIFENNALGIDLGNNGVSNNDPGDADASPNKFQNWPVITSITDAGGGNFDVTYSIDTDPTNAAYPLRVEFFIADIDEQEGQTFIDADTYSTADYNGCGTPPCEKTVTLTPGGAFTTLVATATDDDGNTSEFSVPLPIISAEKTFTLSGDGDGLADPGETITYTITITNNGFGTTSDLAFADDALDANLALDCGNVSPVPDACTDGFGGSFSYDPGTLGALGIGEMLMITFDATVANMLPAGVGAVSNQGTVSYTGDEGTEQRLTDDPLTPTPMDPTVTEIDVSADLLLTKTASTASPDYLDEVTFTLTLENLGPFNGAAAEVKDVLPKGLTFVSSTGDGSYNETTGRWDVAGIDVGSPVSIDITVRVETTEPVTNTATITKTTLRDENPSNNTGSATITPVASDLSVEKRLSAYTEDASVVTATFTLTATNQGPSDATGVVVSDLLDEEATLVSTFFSDATDTYNATTGKWTIGTLAVGETATLTIVITADARSFVLNYAEIAGNEPDQDVRNNVSAVVIGREIPDPSRFRADVSLEKTVNEASPSVGDEVVYTLVVSNGGPFTTAGVEVTDLLPAGVEFVSASFSDESDTYDAATGLWVVGALPDGAMAQIQITVEVTGSGEIVNTAEVTGSHLPDVDSDAGNGQGGEDDQATATLTVQAASEKGRETTTSSEAAGAVPREYALYGNYPNPFNPQTTIPYGVPESSEVRLAVYDVLGREVAVLVEGQVSAGRYEVVWSAGSHPTGVYLVRLEAEGHVVTRRVTLMK